MARYTLITGLLLVLLGLYGYFTYNTITVLIPAFIGTLIAFLGIMAFNEGRKRLYVHIAIVVVVIGPKDLPKFIKQVGSFTKYIKKMSSEFKSSINEIAEEEEIKELAKSVKEVKKIKDGINIKKNFENEIKKIKETVSIAKNEISEIDKK